MKSYKKLFFSWSKERKKNFALRGIINSKKGINTKPYRIKEYENTPEKEKLIQPITKKRCAVKYWIGIIKKSWG